MSRDSLHSGNSFPAGLSGFDAAEHIDVSRFVGAPFLDGGLRADSSERQERTPFYTSFGNAYLDRSMKAIFQVRPAKS